MYSPPASRCQSETGPKKHVGGHVLAPERHRAADDVGVDPVVAGEGGRGTGVGPRTDHQQIRLSRHHAPEPWLLTACAAVVSGRWWSWCSCVVDTARGLRIVIVVLLRRWSGVARHGELCCASSPWSVGPTADARGDSRVGRSGEPSTPNARAIRYTTHRDVDDRRYDRWQRCIEPALPAARERQLAPSGQLPDPFSPIVRAGAPRKQLRLQQNVRVRHAISRRFVCTEVLRAGWGGVRASPTTASTTARGVEPRLYRCARRPPGRTSTGRRRS